MSARHVLALVLVVASSVAVWWYTGSHDGPDEAVEPVVVEPRESVDDSGRRLDPSDVAAPASDERQSAGPSRAGDDHESIAAAGEQAERAVRIHGRVLDLDARPLVDVLVTGTKTVQPVRTDDTGAFSFPAPVGAEHGVNRGVLAVDDERWATVFESSWSASERDREHLVVAAPAIRLAGTVTDEDLERLPGARVRAVLLHQALDRFPHALDASRAADYEANTDGEGRFVLERVPSISLAREVQLAASASGYGSSLLPLPADSRDDVHFLLSKDVRSDAVIEGLVVLPDGAPAEGAEVRFRGAREPAGADGRFRLTCNTEGDDDDALVAVLEGYGPALRASYGVVVTSHAPGSPPTLRLQLTPDLAIEGVVLGADGAPRAGWAVQLADPTPTSPDQVGGLFAEHASKESKEVATDADGRFRLGGLSSREYRLRAHDSETLLRLDSEPVLAGTTGVVLREPSDAYHEALVVRVVDRNALPIEDVRVHMRVVLYENARGSTAAGRPLVRTEEAGVATFARVPRRGVTLSFDGAYVEPIRLDVEDCDDPTGWTVELARRVRFHLVAPAELDGEPRYSFRDADGETCSVVTIRDGSRSSTSHESLTPGRNPLRYVSQDAVRLVVFGDGQEVLFEQEVWLEPEVETEVVLEFP